MEIYLKTVSGILVAIILIQALSQSEKNTALLLSILVCCMVFTAVGSLFQPVIAFIDKLQDLTNINKNMISVLLKVVGIGYISEITTNLCKDIGNTALSKVLQILSLVTLLILSIPIFQQLLELIENVLINL